MLELRSVARHASTIGWVVAVIGLITLKIYANTSKDVARIGFILMLSGATIAIVGKLLSRPKLDLSSIDRNKELILFLRPFSSDKLQLLNRIFRGLFFFGGYFQNIYTHQEIMADLFSPYGLFIAIGKPGEMIPTPRASKIYVDENRWNFIVQEFINQSALIVVQTGSTKNLAWEIECVVKRNRARQTLIYVSDFNSIFEKNRDKNYKLFLECTGNLFPKKLPRDIKDVFCIWFDENWNPIPIKYKKISIAAYLPLLNSTMLHRRYLEVSRTLENITSFVAYLSALNERRKRI